MEVALVHSNSGLLMGDLWQERFLKRRNSEVVVISKL